MSPRAVIWLFHVSLPLLGLWLLVAQPAADLTWQHPPSHFALINLTALVSMGLALVIGWSALRRSDGRLYLVALAFLTSAAFFLVHGVATPGFVLPERGAGFASSAPVGLALAGLLALASLMESDAAAPRQRWRAIVWTGLTGIAFGAWTISAFLSLPPLNDPALREDASPPVAVLASISVALYLAASIGYYRLYRARPSSVTLSIITAWVLLAEASVATAFGRTWRLSWWEWHLLLLLGYGFVAYSAYGRYRREGSVTGLFDAIALQQTVREIRREYGRALRELLLTLRRRVEAGGEVETREAAASVSQRFELTERQADLLGPTAELLREIDDLFLRYTSPKVAFAIWRDPQLSRLGGRSYPSVSVLFADLRGFTAYSEAADPEELFGLLNAYFSAAVPIILERRGTLDKFVGDALMALFNAPEPDPEHALHAASAALEVQAACEALARERPGWPRFRIGINTGPVQLGNVGSEQLRNFTAIGDSVNLASRLQQLAEPGQVVIGEQTYRLIRDAAEVVPLEPQSVKGKQAPVTAYVLAALRVPVA